MRPELNCRQRAEIYLARIQPTTSKHSTWVENFKAAIVLLKGFLIPPQEAIEILRVQFNPRCLPPILSPEELEKVVVAAQNAEDRRPPGWLSVDRRN